MDTDETQQVFIDHAGYPVRTYYRGVTDDLVARFGSPEHGESNLDLAKVASQKGWRGGMFQKKFDDPEMAEYIRGAHHNPLDSALYMVPAMDTLVGSQQMDQEGVTASCVANGNIYIAYRAALPNSGNRLLKIDVSSRAVTSITLPTKVQNSLCPITTMDAGVGFLWVAGKMGNPTASFPIHRMNLSNQAFTEIPNTSVRKLRFWRDKLYTIGLSDLYSLTNLTGAADKVKSTKIKTVGVTEPDLDENVHDLFDFNGALYIAKTDGLYRYDGVDVYPVFDYRSSIEYENFRFGAVFNGRYYFTLGDRKLYQFDGTNLELIQDFSDSYFITGLSSAPDRLFINAVYNKRSATIFPSEAFKENVELENYTYALIQYNGIAFSEYATDLYTGGGKVGGFDLPVEHTLISAGGTFWWVVPDMYFNSSLEPRSYGFKVYYAKRANDFNTAKLKAGHRFEVYSSEIDNDYPSVDKVLLGVQIDYRGFDFSKVNLTLEVATRQGGGSYSEWVKVWDSDQADSIPDVNDYYLHEQVVGELETEPLIYKQIKYRLVGEVLPVPGALATVPRVRSVTLRYSLQPRPRLQWGLGLAIVSSEYDPYIANRKRQWLYNAYRNKKPVLFFDADYAKVLSYDGPLDDAAVTVSGFEWLRDGDVVMFETDFTNVCRMITEVDSFDGETTTFRTRPFGARLGINGGTLFGTIRPGHRIRKCHVVQVTKIHSERYILQPDSINDDNGASNIESELQVDLIEV